uniref:Uncharacterized protein n=1 Tax=Megaselia scalaris TaxID=36166 RepID=T1GHR3_MEGSC
MPWLVALFKSSLELGYIHTLWRQVKVVFIQKAGKMMENYSHYYKCYGCSDFPPSSQLFRPFYCFSATNFPADVSTVVGRMSETNVRNEIL